VGAGAFDRQDGLPPAGGSVPVGFVAESVVLCWDTDVPGDRAGVERTSSDVAPLLNYLSRPSEEPSDGPCTADGWLPPWLFLLDDHGRYVVPEIPVDGCGKPFGWDVEPTGLVWLTLPYDDRVVPAR